ncbi:MAG TPA: BlaI/MecI/CopY family transcriptional regulator [Microbacteriaceae bacterium]|nr:BlaI/MecI/CopY family transcriptional regulator [Microbacteriaceae bacterium]
MATLGDLERAVMDTLWEAAEPLTSSEVQEAIGRVRDGSLAATTVLTVLSRLEKKGFLARDRSTRPHLFRPTHTSTEYTAELMNQVLGSAKDRKAVLTRFVGEVGPGDTEMLRRILESQ